MVCFGIEVIYYFYCIVSYIVVGIMEGKYGVMFCGLFGKFNCSFNCIGIWWVIELDYIIFI